METLKEIIKRQAQEYPLMEMEDAVKLVYQHTFGMDEKLDLEAEYIEAKKDPEEYLCEDIGGGYYRVHLNGLPNGNLDLKKLGDILERSYMDQGQAESIELRDKFEENLKDLYDIVREGYFCFEYKEFQKFLWDYEEKGYPVLAHTRTYESQYEPHYVVVRQDILNEEKASFSKVFLSIYDKKVQNGDITFSKIGVPKPLFVVICNNQNYVPTDELLDKLRVNMKLTDEEARKLYQSAGKESLLDGR